MSGKAIAQTQADAAVDQAQIQAKAERYIADTNAATMTAKFEAETQTQLEVSQNELEAMKIKANSELEAAKLEYKLGMAEVDAKLKEIEEVGKIEAQAAMEAASAKRDQAEAKKLKYELQYNDDNNNDETYYYGVS